MEHSLSQICAAALLAGSMTQAADALPARAELLARAEKGEVEAQLALAIQCREGHGASDDAEWLSWAKKAAEGGSIQAKEMLGVAYFRGAGVERDMKQAFPYLRDAADEFPAAAFHLGECYFGAQGVEQDVAKALEAWEKAAAMGHGRAAGEAAMLYLSGESVPADPVKGRKFAERAAELKAPSGLVILGELHFQAGELDQARKCWAEAAAMKPVGPTGQPTQPSDEMAAQQGADLIKLMDWRKRGNEPGRFVLVPMHHLHQGFNNCGSTSCAMVARYQGKSVGGWDYKRLCPSKLGTGTDWDHLLQASHKLELPWKLVTYTPDEQGMMDGEKMLRRELDANRPVVIDFKFYGKHYKGGSAGHTLTVVGYLKEGDELLYILCNPAICSPGLNFMTRADLDKYWRSDGYSHLSKGVLSRPALVWGEGE